MMELEIEIGPEGISLDLLRAVYRNPSIPLPVRMRAAGMALPFECAKLAVTYEATEQDFATLLDQRIERMKLMEQQKMIEAKPIIDSANGGRPTKENGGNADARLPPTIPDRRYRRF